MPVSIPNINSCFDMKIALFGLCACLAVPALQAQFAANLLSGEVKMRNAAIFLFDGKEPEPTVVRLRDVFTDYENKAFFRICVLPIGGFEGVTFELGERGSVSNGLNQVHKWLTKDTRKRLELRQVRFRAASSPAEYLEAARVRLI